MFKAGGNKGYADIAAQAIIITKTKDHIGVWFINPALAPGEEGPPYPFSVADLTALFAEGYDIVEDYVPDVAFPGREGRERVRVLRRVTGS